MSDGSPVSRLAAIDIGTNSFHLVIVSIDERGRYEIISREKESVRLGHGAGDLDHITPEAQERAVTTLRRFVNLAVSQNARLRAVATSAVREARNRQDFLDRVRQECGLNVEVISGPEEARLIYLGILQALPVYEKKVLLVDIGGGSTEILIGRAGDVEYATSLKLGAIRLHDRFFAREPLDRERVRECRKFIRVSLARIRRELPDLDVDIVVGCSGTIDTLAEMIALASSPKSTNSLREKLIQVGELDQTVRDILSHETSAGRVALRGLDDKRADIIVGGAIILQEFFRTLELKSLTFSPFALREGIIFDTFARRHPDAHPTHNLRKSSVRHLADIFHNHVPTPDSTRQISRLCRLILDGLKAGNLIPEIDANDEFLLESAALLHNIGVVIGHSAHHKHGYYIIRNSERMMGFSPLEIEMIALLTRYHRKAMPHRKHVEFRQLSGEDRRKLEILGSILRLAIGLDRGGRGRVDRIRIVEEKRKVVFLVVPGRDEQNSPLDITLELWASRMNSVWFARVFGRPVELRVIYEFDYVSGSPAER